MLSPKHKNILVAPLDWGLGHTSRCIPVIRYILDLGHQVVFAGNEGQIDFIYKTFPGIACAFLEGYNVTYSRSGTGFIPSIMLQAPHILNMIRKEHHWLMEICKRHHFDGIVSDNRYGLHHPNIPSVIMTHQLHVQTTGGALSDSIFALLHYKMFSRFGHCWVVDVPGQPNLGGRLAHPRSLPRNAAYMGLLSQFQQPTMDAQKKHLLILLSGPEPQRSMLSTLLWQQLQGYNGPLVFIEGSNDTAQPAEVPAHVQYHRRLTQSELQPLIENASMVICRSGYSTIMDLVRLGKNAILIPTPGQTEQEYLARHLHNENIFYSVAQNDLDLNAALKNAAAFTFNKLPLQDAYTMHKPLIDNWLLSLPDR